MNDSIMQELTDKELTDDEEGFEDDGVAESEDEEEVNHEQESRRRGKDQNWTLLESYEFQIYQGIQ